jgi:hypothetical protein
VAFEEPIQGEMIWLLSNRIGGPIQNKKAATNDATAF